MKLNKTQREVLKKLEQLWEANPGERFGQLLFNHTRIGTRVVASGLIVGVEDFFFYLDEDISQDIELELLSNKKE